MKPTDKCSEQLAEILRRAHPRQAKKAVAAFDLYADQITAYQKTGTVEEAAGVAAGLLEPTDSAIAEQLEKDVHAPRIACKPGCSHCCYIEVRATVGEAAWMIYGALQTDVSFDMALLREQAAAEHWTDLPHERRACAFLGVDGQCTVYDYRPTACRKYFTLDDPANCDTLKQNGARVINLIVPLAEIINSALISRQKNGRLPNMLLEVAEPMHRAATGGNDGSHQTSQ